MFELTEPQTFKDCFSNSRNIVGKKLAVFGLNLPVLKCEEATTWRTSFGDSEADQPVCILGTLSVCDSLPGAFVVPDVELCGVTVCRSSRCRLAQCQPLVSTWTVVLRCVRRRRSTCVICGVWTAIVLTLLDLEVTFRFVGRGRRI